MSRHEPPVDPPTICDLCAANVTRSQTLVTTPDGVYHLHCFVGSPDAV